MIWAASRLSRRSAFRPLATPVAFVTNGLLASPPAPTVKSPPIVPREALNSNA
jgi:hypothetical protein